MSLIGTAIAAAVAQTVNQAQQVSRERDRQDNQATAQAHKVQDKFESHLKGFEDSNQAESPAHLHVDGQVPEHESGQQGQSKHPRGRQRPPYPAPGAPLEGPAATETLQADGTPPAPPAKPQEPLYQHLDLQA